MLETRGFKNVGYVVWQKKMKMKEHNYNENLRFVKRSDRVTATLSPGGAQKPLETWDN